MKKLIIASAMVIGIGVLTGCSSLDSMKKDFESNTKGLERVVTVYSKTGEILHQWEGSNIRTKSSGESNNIVFEIDGKRVVVYNADVVIEEKGDN